MKLSQFYSNYLRAADVKKPLKVEITTVEITEFKDRQNGTEKQRAVLYFQELEQGLIVNATNRIVLESLLGEDTDDWIGKSIEIYNDKTVSFNGQTGGVRVREVEAKKT